MPLVELWTIDLNRVPEAIDQLPQTLSLDEIARARRFRKRADQTQYAVTRRALRAIVARRISALPRNLAFGYSEHGKPFLKSPSTLVQFSVSHAAGLAVIALSEGGLIGADVEMIQTAGSMLATSNVAFSGEELELLKTYSDAERARRIAAAWVVKEAILKADGRGLSVEPCEIPVVRKLSEFSGEILHNIEALTKRWSIRVLEPRPNFVAAVASSLATFELAVREWEATQSTC